MLVSKVLDVFGTSEPAFLAAAELLLRMDAGHHAVVEEGVWLAEVYDV